MVMVDSQGDVCAVCLKPSCAYPVRGEPASGGTILTIPPGVSLFKALDSTQHGDLPLPKRSWPIFALWLFAAFSAAVFAATYFAGCATLDAFATAHPDVVQKAETAVELAQCVDTAVVKYKRAEAASTAAAVTTLPPPTPEGTP